MVRKHELFPLVLASILTVLLMASCTGQNTTSTSYPVIVATKANPVVTEMIPTATSGIVAISATVTKAVEPAAPDGNFSLTVLHTNDIHAHHAPNADGDGGAALAASVINQVRSACPNTLLLSAGDTFIGTLFYVMHHGTDSAELMNKMQYDAMTLGNHEFDEGDGNLALFIEQLNFPVVAANVNFDGSTALKDKTVPYMILEKGGEKIGVIGLVNPETPTMSHPGSDLTFQSDLAQIVQSNVKELTKEGVNKIIVLSHIGYQADLELAQAVMGVDIIVGGHTHTLLANFDTRAVGAYPTEVKNPEDKTVLVVQTGENLEYLGRLDVEFDPNGELVQWKGDTIRLSHYITPDPSVSALVETLYTPIEALTSEVIGKSTVYLEGDRKVCRFKECNLGNLITDAMRAETGAQVALENGGGIRASIEQGAITLGDVLTVLPFGNLTSTLNLSGKDLLAVLENGVSTIEEGGGRFLQVSGLRYQFDPLKPAGSRIVSVEVLDSQGEYQVLDPMAIYSVATNDFLREGGDGFTVMAENGIDAYDYGRPLDQVLADYIKAHDPVTIGVEGRIIKK
jgi:5'-nucleotidase/UDP-sugar diphosphatase